MWSDGTPHYAWLFLALPLLVLVRPRPGSPQPQGADRRQRRGVRDHIVLPGCGTIWASVPALVLRRSGCGSSSPTCSCTAGIFHILFNMLALWMFGAELERIWGSRYFLKFYFVTGIGAGVLTVLFSLLPFGSHSRCYTRDRSAHRAPSSACCSPTRCTFPDRPIYIILFQVPAKISSRSWARSRCYRRSPMWAASPTRAPRRPPGRLPAT